MTSRHTIFHIRALLTLFAMLYSCIVQWPSKFPVTPSSHVYAFEWNHTFLVQQACDKNVNPWRLAILTPTLSTNAKAYVRTPKSCDPTVQMSDRYDNN
jgi:hypothetical protein